MVARRVSISLFVGFCAATLGVGASDGGCTDTTYPTLTGGGGYGGAIVGVGGSDAGIIAYPDCRSCLDPVLGVPGTVCAPALTACASDPACAALTACVLKGLPPVMSSTTGGGAPGVGGNSLGGGGNVPGSGGNGLGGGGNVPGSGGSGLGGGGNVPGSGGSGLGGGGNVPGSGGSGLGGGGNAPGSGGNAPGSGGSLPGGGGAGGMGTAYHGLCDHSLEGACCTLDCAAALGTPSASVTLYEQAELCVSCAECRDLCDISEAYCDALAPGATVCPSK